MHDLIIIGSGPAGITAAIYAARYKLKTAVISKETGGSLAKAPLVENWPGTKGISGIELMQQMSAQAKALGVEFISADVSKISRENSSFKIKADNDYSSRFLLLATGCQRRKLNVPGEKEFSGMGVSYCATCDAALFANKDVAVVGGSNAAAVSAEMLANYAKKVYIIYRKERIRADPVVRERVESNRKIEIINNSNITEIKGAKFVESVKLDTGKEVPLQGVFVEIGADPCTELAMDAKIDDEGFIVVNASQETTVKGLYAAGDLTTNSSKFEQAITAAAEGAVAAAHIYRESKG